MANVNLDEIGDIVGTFPAPGFEGATECKMEAFYTGAVPVRAVNRQCSLCLLAVANVAGASKAGFYDIGARDKLRKNLRHLESLSKLEPVTLEKRIALADCDNDSIGSLMLSIDKNLVLNNEEEYNKSGKKSEELLEHMKARTPSMSLKLNSDDNIFFDFFIEATCEGNNVSDCELLDMVKDWMNGEPQEELLG